MAGGAKLAFMLVIFISYFEFLSYVLFHLGFSQYTVVFIRTKVDGDQGGQTHENERSSQLIKYKYLERPGKVNIQGLYNGRYIYIFTFVGRGVFCFLLSY